MVFVCFCRFVCFLRYKILLNYNFWLSNCRFSFHEICDMSSFRLFLLSSFNYGLLFFIFKKKIKTKEQEQEDILLFSFLIERCAAATATQRNPSSLYSCDIMNFNVGILQFIAATLTLNSSWRRQSQIRDKLSESESTKRPRSKWDTRTSSILFRACGTWCEYHTAPIFFLFFAMECVKASSVQRKSLIIPLYQVHEKDQKKENSGYNRRSCDIHARPKRLEKNPYQKHKKRFKILNLWFFWGASFS